MAICFSEKSTYKYVINIVEFLFHNKLSCHTGYHIAKLIWVLAICALVSFFIHQRELARQTTDIIKNYCATLENDGFPSLRTVLCIGGTALKDQLDVIKRSDYY